MRCAIPIENKNRQLQCEEKQRLTKTEKVREKKEREREKIWGKKLGWFCGVFYIEEHKIAG